MNPKKQLPGLEVMANDLAERLSDVGIQRGVALVAKGNTEMIGLLREGAVDIVSETVFSGIRFPKKGVPNFCCANGRRGSPNTEVSSLRAATVASVRSKICVAAKSPSKIVARRADFCCR